MVVAHEPVLYCPLRDIVCDSSCMWYYREECRMLDLGIQLVGELRDLNKQLLDIETAIRG